MKNYHTKKLGQPFWIIALTLLIFFFLFCMILRPEKFIAQGLNGISAWAFNVLPSVFPFMFFTRVLSSLNIMSTLCRPFSGISRVCFKTPSISIYAFTMAIFSGYPVGTKTVADLFLQGKITKEDAFKMTSFCSTSGPMFIVGAVGIAMFHSATIGYILFISHVLGAIINGIVFRNFKLKENEKLSPQSENAKNSSLDISDIVTNSTMAILSVGAIITIFFIVIECFSPILSLLPQNIAYLFEGVIEITKGCIDLATLPNKFLAVVLASFVVSFGGISTILQSLTMLAKLKMPVKLFVLQKLLHGIFAMLISILLALLIL
ncbi:MAG: hypothetical protein K2K31_00970 [Clostridia bacterium]|nr:hypothetical protein [Clostridia bacterium]